MDSPTISDILHNMEDFISNNRYYLVLDLLGYVRIEDENNKVVYEVIGNDTYDSLCKMLLIIDHK